MLRKVPCALRGQRRDRIPHPTAVDLTLWSGKQCSVEKRAKTKGKKVERSEMRANLGGRKSGGEFLHNRRISNPQPHLVSISANNQRERVSP